MKLQLSATISQLDKPCMASKLAEVILQRGKWNLFFFLNVAELPENLETSIVTQPFNYLNTKIL